MSGINISSVPEDFKKYFSYVKNEAAGLEKPSKLLKFYIYHRINYPTQAGHPFLLTVCRQLLFMRTSKALSDYHFVKLLCACPEFVTGREQEFVQAYVAFEDQFKGLPEDKKMTKRAIKVSNWLKKNQALRVLISASHPLDKEITASEGEKFTVDRLRWAAEISAYRPFLLDQFPKSKPLGSSLTTLQSFQRFMDNPSSSDFLFSLSKKDFWTLHREAHAVNFKSLVELSSIYDMVDGDNAMEILSWGLDTKNEKIIKNCIEVFNNSNNGVRLQWSLSNGLKPIVDELDPDVESILEGLAPYFQRVRFNQRAALDRVVNQELPHFSNVTKLELMFAVDEPFLGRLPSVFPNVTHFGCPLETFDLSESQPPYSWAGIEVIEILGKIKLEEIRLRRPSLGGFPNLKVCFWEYPYDIYLEKSFGIAHRHGDVYFINPTHKGQLDTLEFSSAVPIELSKYILADDFLTTEDKNTDNTHFKSLIIENTESGDKIDFENVLEVIKKCPNLKTLKLCNDPSKITKDNLRAVAKLLPGLTVLQLSFCDQIDDELFSLLNEWFPLLTILNLSGTPVGMKSLSTLENPFPNLRELNLSFCPNIDDPFLLYIGTHFKSLQKLNLNKTNGTDEGFIDIARGCRQLQLLSIEDTQITKKALAAISVYCEDLQKISVIQCPHISDEEVVVFPRKVEVYL